MSRCIELGTSYNFISSVEEIPEIRLHVDIELIRTDCSTKFSNKSEIMKRVKNPYRIQMSNLCKVGGSYLIYISLMHFWSLVTEKLKQIIV